MKMFYRGVKYDVNLPKIEADSVENIGTYRGAPATRKHFHLNNPARHNRVEMTYRGVRYSQEV
jgi:hypothetical protein